MHYCQTALYSASAQGMISTPFHQHLFTPRTSIGNASLMTSPKHHNLSFFFIGLLNNLTFVIFITLSEQILLHYASVILLCCVLPGLAGKVVFATISHHFSYPVRVSVPTLASSISLLLVAIVPKTWAKLLCIAIQAFLSAWGEITFLSLTSFFDPITVGYWSGGTGAAGIAGAGVVVIANALNVGPRAMLIFCSWLPLIILLLYYFLLHAETGQSEPQYHYLPEEALPEDNNEMQLRKRTFFPQLFRQFIIPLALVYFAEYTINQGVLGTLTSFADGSRYPVTSIFPVLQLTYQIGVFVSRSSITFVRMPCLYLMASLQFMNLAIFTVCAMFNLFPHVTVAVLAIFWEGLLGGATYVNAFYRIRKESPQHLREWALGVATTGDSFGVAMAAGVGMWLEQAILSFILKRDS